MSSNSRFDGKGLDEYLQAYTGLTRIDGETDWEFRKRAFIESFDSDPLAATEYLIGTRREEFNSTEQLDMQLAMRCRDKAARQKFAAGFNIDPAEKRK